MDASTRPRVRHGDGLVVQVHLELAGIGRRVWRRLLVSDRVSLLELHAVIERALGWTDARAHRFEVDGIRYTDVVDDGPVALTTDRTALRSLHLETGTRLLHEADTGGDPWRSVLAVEQVRARLVGERLPACIEGEGAGPPEDCEGPTRYRALLGALDSPEDPRAAELREWLPEHFDPRWVDFTSINARLARLPKHRPAA